MLLSSIVIYFWFYFDAKNFSETVSRYFEIKPLTSSNNTTNNQSMIFNNTQTATIVPTKIIDISPTKIIFPTEEITEPIVKPTIVPITIPTIAPTKSEEININYEAIKNMVANPPVVGCRPGQTCDALSYTNLPLMKGIGFATYYGDESITGYNVVADVIHNWKKISMDDARKFIADHMMAKQSDMTPSQAKATGKVITYGATRTCKDLGKIKYLFGIDSPASPQPRFIGRMMIVDCARVSDWVDKFATWYYSYQGWDSLNWILDISKNGYYQLPAQTSTSIGGRPGVVVIDESIVGSL
jgi:hypothetical protein